MSSYLHRAFDFMSLSCQVWISECIRNLYLAACKELLGSNRSDIWNLNDWNKTQTDNNLFLKKTLNHLAQITKWLSWIVGKDLYGGFDYMSLSCHACISECIHNLYLAECKELLGSNRIDIWNLSDWNKTQIHNHLLLKKTLNHLAKITKWLSWIVSKYLYGAFECMSLSFHGCISEWINNLYFLECHGIPCWKQEQYLQFKSLQRDLNPQKISSSTKTPTFGQTHQKMELNCGYLSVWCILLYVIMISRTHFRVNLHVIYAWILRNTFFGTGAISET